MATVWYSKREGQLIVDRIDQAFVSQYHYRYWISIVAFLPINGYNLFFYRQRPGEYTHSIPIARLVDASFSQLIAILKIIRESYQFTFTYRGFSRQERQIFRMEVN